MTTLTPTLLAHACRVFFRHAYPEGCIPEAKRPFLEIAPDQSLGPLLVPPIYHPLYTTEGSPRGCAFRLGSSHYPHLKLQVVEKEGVAVFAVDTHDQIHIPPEHPDAARLAGLQEKNRQLKQQIERDWEAEGLTTFNALLRRELEEGA
jgi:hypothetical protein